MLKKLRIKNFQKHGQKTIEFDERITTIVGPSDAGKSSIIRALSWVFLNNLAGDSFIKHGEEEAKVQVRIGEHKITRSKGKANTYHLDGKKLVSFGRNVPDLVDRVLNVGPTNFQGQYDGFFWFTLSGTDVSRNLNAIVNMEIMDRAVEVSQKEARRTKSRASVLKEELDDAKEEKKGLPDVGLLQEEFTAMEEAEKSLKSCVAAGGHLRYTLHELRAKSKQAAQRRQLIADYEVLRKHGVKWYKAYKRREALGVVVSKLANLETTVVNDVTNLDAEFNRLTDTANRYEQVQSEASRLGEILDQLIEQRNAQCQAKENVLEAQRLLPNRCPTCHAELPSTPTT